ncbi:ceramide glucosyltransferase-like isoform X2 [Ostrea edulis]|uniref:ceramide glucosyltransferase-like isoform X2 n=1 Tax=Ostrea edulis TaxID=37623 RepID=UPI0024AF9A3E|nr:ceramide glucosyltransferase-like isoform X2 [Ostrea edulis]XP_055995234.1 ceramide glucosyltransferase-like isoform X2 [Ostrea edulis]
MYHLDAQSLDYVLFFLAVVSIIFFFVFWTISILSFIGAKCVLYRKSDLISFDEDLSGVSVIKPLMGVDPLLEENLESHFTMKFPNFELLFCVPDDQDPAINLVQRLQEKYPNVDTRLFIGGKEGIINPMVFNMAPAYENAKYPNIWISTSRIKASSEIILDLACKLNKPNVGIVHQMPFVTDQKGFAASLEKIYFGCALSRCYIALNQLNQACCTGMSYMFKKSVMDDVNGLIYYGKYLAEDFFLTQAIHEKGYRLVLSAFPAQQNVAAPTVRAFKDRMVRWIRLRINMMPFVSGVLEPLHDVLVLSLHSSWAFYHFFGINPYYFFTCHVILICMLDYIHLRNIQDSEVVFLRRRKKHLYKCISSQKYILLKKISLEQQKHDMYNKCGTAIPSVSE